MPLPRLSSPMPHSSPIRLLRCAPTSLEKSQIPSPDRHQARHQARIQGLPLSRVPYESSLLVLTLAALLMLAPSPFASTSLVPLYLALICESCCPDQQTVDCLVTPVCPHPHSYRPPYLAAVDQPHPPHHQISEQALALCTPARGQYPVEIHLQQVYH